MKKSYLCSLLLTMVFGPLGLLYSSVAAAIGFLLVALALAISGLWFSLVIVWPVVMVVGLVTVGGYNSRVALADRRHRELLDAVRASSGHTDDTILETLGQPRGRQDPHF